MGNMRKFGLTTWNIGFSQYSPQDIINNHSVGKIQWLKHSYRDRFFADPFILCSSDSEIRVLVEELEFNTNKGRITELTVDAKTKKLMCRKPLLELDSHLSYPAIIYNADKILVCPENSEGGTFSLYEYNENSRTLSFVSEIVKGPLVDSTIYKFENCYYLFATKVPLTQQDAYIYQSENLFGPYTERCCVSVGKGHSRPAGNLFRVGEINYRPTQNCVARYGAFIEIMKIESFTEYRETYVFSLMPKSFKYHLGLHTINFSERLCVVDGKGYLYPVVGRIYNVARKIYYSLKKYFKNEK